MDLQTIRAKARRKLDETSTGNDNVFWTDDELDDYVNDGYLHYWQWLINARHPGVVKVTTLNITAGNDTISLPSDYISARLVERVLDNCSVPMQYRPRFDTVRYTSGVSTNSLLGYIPDYDFIGTSLVVNPTPAESVTGGIRLTYVFNPTRLSADGDEPNAAFSEFFHDLLVGWTVIQGKEKEEMIGGGGADLSPFHASQSKREAVFKSSIEVPTQQRIYSEPWGSGY